MLGFVALTVLMVMAFVGVTSAMAGNTQLCKTETVPCSSAATSAHQWSVGKGVLESELPTIECNVSFFSTSVGALGAPQVVEGWFTYSTCNNFCSVKEENGPAELKILRTGTELAAVTYEFLVRVKCPFINCSFNGAGLEGHLLGALSAANSRGEYTILLGELNAEFGGEMCPAFTFLRVTTETTSTTYVSS